MKISIITLFPEMFEKVFDVSMISRAKERGTIEIEIIQLRDFGIGTHKVVDDKPYGGGIGMVLRVDVLDRAIQKTKKNKQGELAILLDPKGKKLDQALVERFSKKKHLVLVCGHYEGYDERVRDIVDEEISIGDFVLSGGEIGAMALIDSIVRLIPGNLEKEATTLESFSDNNGKRGLEHPQYTRPAIYKNKKVPEELLSGNPKIINAYRETEALKLTKKRRPDLLK
jgi:tRNA (guanine37-N1)-methyltransferase